MSTAPYIGCRITLISKSDIRYEGTLYTIDPKESTVALQNVTSFGTEDRLKPGDGRNPVPSNPNVYEFIVFRATDIKDLQICERPQAPAAPPLEFQDPAIVGMNAPYPTYQYPPQQPYPQYGHFAAPSHYLPPTSAAPSSTEPAAAAPAQSQPNSQTLVPDQTSAPPKAEESRAPKPQGERSRAHAPRNNETKKHETADGAAQSSADGAAQSSAHHHSSQKSREKYSEEFDYSVRELQLTDAEQALVQNIQPAYNKSSSFFDSISRDTGSQNQHQHQHGSRPRQSWKDQRSHDIETFGTTMNIRGRGSRGRGRGRGRARGRGESSQ